MAVAVAWLGITLDQGIRGDWLRARIALVEESAQRDWHFRLCSGYDLVRNAEGLIVECSCAKIGVKGHGCPDEGDDVG